jgi:hypothetical protein
MPEGKITEYVDRSGVKSDSEFMLAQLNSIQEKFTVLSEFKLKLNTDGSFKDAANTQAALKKATDELATATKAYKTAQDQIIANQAKINEAGTTNAQVIAQQKLQIQQLTAENKQAAKEALGLVSAYDKLQAQFKAANTEAKNIGASQGIASKAFQEASARAKALNDQLKAIDASNGNFQRNVGNYAGSLKPAFDVLTQQLQTLKTEMAGLDKGTPAFNQTAQQVEKLETVISGLQGGFSSTRSELRAFQEAAVQLGLTFGQTDEQFLSFNEAVGEVKNSIQDIKKATAFQAKDNKGFVGLIEAANGLAGAFGAAQGAATLLSDGDEDLQKKMVQLQALLVIINGLQQVANALETESGAIQLALSIKTSLLSAARKVQNLLIVQTVAAIQAEVVANTELAISEEAKMASMSAGIVVTEEAAVANASAAAAATTAAGALEAEAVAAGEAATATGSFTAAFIATGIGGVIVAVAAALVYLTIKFKDYLQEGKLTNKMQGEILDSMKATNEAFIKQGEIIDKLDGVTKRYYQNVLDQSAAAGANENTLFAIKQNLNKEEETLAQQEVNRLGATNEAYSEQTSQVQELQHELEGLNKIREDAILASRGIANQSGIAKADADVQKEAAENNISNVEKQLAAIEPLFLAMGKARERLSAANKSTADDETKNATYNAEQQRKLVLETIQIESDAVKAKNDAILNSERATQDARLNALRSNRTAQIAVINAQKNDVLDNPASSEQEKIIAVEKANEELKALQIKFGEDIYQINESYRLRNLAAEDEINKSRIQASKDANDAIIHDENNSLGQRLTAYANYIDAEKQLADEEFSFKLKAAGFSDEEIAALQRGDQVQIKGKKITLKELEALEVQHVEALKAINNGAGKAIYDITKSWADKQEKAILDSNKLNTDPTALKDQYNVSLAALNDSFKKKLISAQIYDSERLKLERAFQIQDASISVEGDKKDLAALEKHQDEIKDKVLSAKEALASAQASGNAQAVIDDEAVLKALLEAENQNADEILKVRVKLADDTLKMQDNLLAEQLKNERELASAKKQLETEGVAFAQALGNGQFETKINNLQTQIDQVNTLRDAEIAAENASTDSAQVKADKIAVITATAAAQQTQLQLKQKQEKRKEAEFDRELAIAKIVFDTEQAVAHDLKGNKLLIPFDIAQGAVAIATILATPIPNYRYGTEDHPGGLAKAGHGRPELVMLPSGEAFITPSTEVLYNLPEHTRVLPDANAAISDGVLNSLIMKSLVSDMAYREKIEPVDFGQHANRIISAIENKPVVKVSNTYLGMQVSHYSATKHWKWVNKNMQS